MNFRSNKCRTSNNLVRCEQRILTALPLPCVVSFTDGILPSGIAPADVFIISRLNDTTSYFFSWFCKKYRIRIGARDLGDKEETQSRCPICLDACTKSIIELQCGHAFCRSCLTRSAANNMTSCALCRREQEINPELLRARFDEQRVLNLAQRLAIPPPMCSRPSTSGVSMPAGEGEREQKEGTSLGSTPTSAREMLFGPWGDVGAMSADDLRRRWNFSGVQMSTAPGAATVGASSASELRSSWCELQSRSSMYVCSEREYLGTADLQVSHGARTRADSMSCSGNAEAFVSEVDAGGSRSPTVSPDSPCAGGTSLSELSVRWCNLTRISPEITSGCDRVHHAAEETSHGELPTLFEMSDSGGLGAASLRKRWHEANGVNGVGALTVSELRGSLNLAIGPQGVGGIPGTELKTRWNASCTETERNAHVNGNSLHESVDNGAKTDSDDTVKPLCLREQAVGAVSTSALHSRWCAAVHRPAPVG